MGDELDEIHTPKSEVEMQAERFRSCFEPNAYELDKHFSWMTESQREELGKRADAALKQAYLTQISEMYSGD